MFDIYYFFEKQYLHCSLAVVPAIAYSPRYAVGYSALSGLYSKIAATINGAIPNVPTERKRQFYNWLPMIRSYGTAAGTLFPPSREVSGLYGKITATINAATPNISTERKRQFYNWLPIIRSYGTAAGTLFPSSRGVPAGRGVIKHMIIIIINKIIKTIREPSC
ncbi:hypothetical protein DRW42_16140 [Pedobacter miscanthi]|uniref:Uncharacterized protein n=1 Tax=Pedobacter miscanthi TaxID=2259170 RepID=A0A366KWP7_9SPHI|nr:hypothetical protein DRW42_16140 [Pedobacter miscanthi]